MLYSHKRAQNFTAYVTDERLPGLRFGICIINTCSEQDLTNIARTLLGTAAKIVKNCVTSVDEGISTTQAWVIAFLTILTTKIVGATGFELLTENWEKKRQNAILYRCTLAFSTLSNTRRILNVNKDKNSETYSYRFMHGVRFLSIFWICLGHSYGTITENITRLLNALHYFERWETLIVTAGFLAVDTFFFLSGFLLYYTLSKQKQNRAVVAVVAIIRRFIRTTVPLFMIMCMCMYLLPLIASGPDSKQFYKMLYTEIRNHWWDILFQLRNWRADEDVSTMTHLWYLSADYLFFLVAVVVILLCRKRKWLVATIFTVLSVLCCGVSAWQVYGTSMTPFLVAVWNTYSTVIDTLNHYYMLPFYHGVCFFSGCITFMLVERYGQSKMSKVIQASLWGISLFCGLYCLFMKFDWYRSNERDTETMRMFYAFTDRIFWSVCVAWFIFACATGRGGIVNSFLSWNGFVPLSRLSFGVYLIHSPFYIFMYRIARERIFFSHSTLVSQCFSVLVWSYILRYFLFIACDAPTGHLEKLLFMPERRRAISESGAAAGSVRNNTKNLPVGIIEEGTTKNYFNGVAPSLARRRGWLRRKLHQQVLPLMMTPSWAH